LKKIPSNFAGWIAKYKMDFYAKQDPELKHKYSKKVLVVEFENFEGFERFRQAFIGPTWPSTLSLLQVKWTA
jgi:ERCC4-type nuclease